MNYVIIEHPLMILQDSKKSNTGIIDVALGKLSTFEDNLNYNDHLASA